MGLFLVPLSLCKPIFFVLLLPSFLTIVVSFLFWVRNPRVAQSLPSPPGPWSLPIIGSFHRLGRLPHRSLQRLSKVYGPLMFLRLGSLPAIVVSSPAMAKQVLKTHDVTFATRTRMTSGVVLFNSADIGMAPYGPYWRLMRQICAKDLFSNKMLEIFDPIRTDEVRSLMRGILEDSKIGREVPVASRLLSATNNIICRMTIGMKFTEAAGECNSDNPSENVVAIISEVMALLPAFNIGDFIPYLQSLDIQGYVRRMKKTARKIKAVFQKIIDSRREGLKLVSGTSSYFVDVLLNIAKERRGDISLSDDNIMAVLVDMFSAGTETSAFTVEWALAELLSNPSVLMKVQIELDSVVGNKRLVQESDFERLPFLTAVVKETMRLHPAVTLINRDSMEACEVAGYHLSAKTLTLINVWAIGRDETAWEKPLEFLPERFLGNCVDVQGHHYELLPFGTGRRSCPGWKLGLKNVKLMLANLVHGFNWSLPSGKTELDMSEKFSTVTTLASPLSLLAVPRLSEDLYA